MKRGVGRQKGGQGNKFRLRLSAGTFPQEKFDKFQACVAAVGVRVGAPDPIHGVMVVANGVVNRAAPGSHASQCEIDGAVLRRALPQRLKVGLGFVEAPFIAQSAAQAQLILGVGPVASKRGAEFLDGAIGGPGIEVRHPMSIEPAAAGLLVSIEAGYQVADCGKRRYRSQDQDHKHEDGGPRDELGQELEHVSRPDITLNHCRDAGLVIRRVRRLLRPLP